MKKVTSLFLVLIMLLSAVPVFAAEEEKVILKEDLFDYIEDVAEAAGAKVFRNDEAIGVMKDAQCFVVVNDTVTYMDNYTIVEESLYVDGVHVKVPQKAMDIVFAEKTYQQEDDIYVYSRYFSDLVENDVVYMSAINQSVEDEDCKVEMKEVLTGWKNMYITLKVTPKSERGRTFVKSLMPFSWVNFYETSHGHFTVNVHYKAYGVTIGDNLYLLFRYEREPTVMSLRMETIYNEINEYLDVEIPDMEEEIKVEFYDRDLEGGYILLKPLRTEYYIAEPKMEYGILENPEMYIKFKDGTIRPITSMCVTAQSTTKTTVNGIEVRRCVNYFKKPLDLNSVESVILKGIEYFVEDNSYQEAGVLPQEVLPFVMEMDRDSDYVCKARDFLDHLGAEYIYEDDDILEFKLFGTTYRFEDRLGTFYIDGVEAYTYGPPRCDSEGVWWLTFNIINFVFDIEFKRIGDGSEYVFVP